MVSQNSTPGRLAAIDLGSNKFHIAIVQNGPLGFKPLVREGERVQLAAGLAAGRLTAAAIERGLDCVRGFAQLIDQHQPDALRIVATHAMRIANNARDFLGPAQDILQHPIDVISGTDEARLIYRGVAHERNDEAVPRLVIDIGGGSTELIAGRGDEIMHCDSLDVGCLTLCDRFFSGSDDPMRRFDDAVHYVRGMLAGLDRHYDGRTSACVGTSGALFTIAQLANEKLHLPAAELTADSVLALPRHIRAGLLEDVDLARRAVCGAGIAIVTALFVQFNISQLVLAHSDLRDGVLLDLAKKAHNAPVTGLATDQRAQPGISR